MGKLTSQPDPGFVRAIENGLRHWLALTEDMDAEKIAEIDPQKDNLFRILDFGLQVLQLWTLTAELLDQIFPLADRRGYWLTWQKKILLSLDGSPQVITPLFVQLLIRYGKSQRSLWQREEAIKTHHRAMQYAQQLNKATLLARVFLELGWDYFTKSDLESATVFGEKALQLWEGTQQSEEIQVVDTLRLLGNSETGRGHIDPAIKYLKDALHKAESIRKPIVLARTYVDLSMAYQRKKDFQKALIFLRYAAEVLSKTIYDGDKFHVLNNIGTNYFEQEMWAAAEGAFLKADTRKLRESGDLVKQAMLRNNLGNVYLKQGKLEDAEWYLQESLNLHPEIGDNIGWANTLAAMAELRILQKRFNEAAALIKEAREKLENYRNHAWAREIREELKELQKRMEREQEK